MYVDRKQYKDCYHTIVSSSRSSPSSKTYILVSPDVDAVCAARQLHALLKADYVPNTVIPVSSWSQLESLYARLDGEDIRSLVLINVGALIDVAAYFSYLPPECIIHIIDSHRPVNLANLFSFSSYATMSLKAGAAAAGTSIDARIMPHVTPELSVIVWGDGEEREDLREAYDALLYEPESDSESDDSDESDDDLPRRRRRRSSSSSSSTGSRASKRHRSGSPQPLTKAEKRKFRAKIQKYYESGTFHGQSVANSIFILSVLLRRETIDGLWNAILGLTYQFLTNQIDRDRYDDLAHALADEVARLSTGETSMKFTAEPVVSTGPEDRSIKLSLELRLCLFRHWTLYDAMFHSGYVAGRMKLWKERGVKNLSGLLAKMGYSLQQSRETYQHMDVDLKSRLYNNIDALAPEYGLNDLSYESFVRKSGFRSDISAADTVEGIGALLEAATGVRLDFGTGAGREEWTQGIKSWVSKNGEQHRLMNGKSLADGGAAVEDEAGQQDEGPLGGGWQTRNFWLAWDALDPDTSLLRRSLPLAMAVHRAIIGQGTYVIEKQAIKTLRTYRVAVINEGPDLAAFRHPSTLMRLAHWLVDAVRELLSARPAAERKKLPLVLACVNEDNDSFLVVGVVGGLEYGDVKKNQFGIAFQKAAEASGARTRHNAFEASVVEVRRDDLSKFLQLLALS